MNEESKEGLSITEMPIFLAEIELRDELKYLYIAFPFIIAMGMHCKGILMRPS
jgi:hypothetical protein